jgi:hypothetical protein
MFAYCRHWIAATRLHAEAQHVIVLRLARIAAGGAGADAECRRMVSEKIAAAAAAQTAAISALARGKSIDAAAQLALVPVERTVRANRRRLLRARRIDALVRPWRRLAARTRALFAK